ncbi:MAG: hypothetical protein RIF34_08485, partial [Candidatus Kapaibacterium sp.]
HSGGRFFIKNLNPGTYVIRYGNIWRQSLTDSIELNSYLRGYKVCIDNFKKRDHYPLLELFNEAKNIRIEQVSTGCFHHSLTQINFQKMDDYILATYKSEDKKRKIKIKSASDLKLITNFFSRIDLLDGPGGCTTTDDYKFSFDGTTIEISDSSCDWDGFYQLTKQLF